MKLLNFKTAGLVFLLATVSCSNGNNAAKLTQLEKKRDALNEQIRKLKAETADSNAAGTKILNAPTVAVKEMQLVTFRHYIEVQGHVDGEENLGISARSMGAVEEVNVSMGDKVSKGEILARLDDDVLQQNLNQLESNYQFASEMYEKQKNLWDKKIGSEVQYLTAKNNKESLENNIKTLKDQIEMTRIKSPINGTVEYVGVKIGQSVAPGVPIFRVINFSSVKVVAEISEFYSSRVNQGDEAEIEFPDLDKKITAKITSASKYINPQNRTFEIEVRLNPEASHFKANMVAIVRINDYKSDNAIVVPINLIQNDNEGKYVMLAVNSNTNPTAKKVRVDIGESYNGLVEITGGLEPGDDLITAGQVNLQDGEAIRM